MSERTIGVWGYEPHLTDQAPFAHSKAANKGKGRNKNLRLRKLPLEHIFVEMMKKNVMFFFLNPR